jgi:lysine 2,3-aminomutase
MARAPRKTRAAEKPARVDRAVAGAGGRAAREAAAGDRAANAHAGAQAPRASGDRVLRTAQDLIGAGLAPESARAVLTQVAARYAVAIPPALAALIDPDDPADPIARQFTPGAEELISRAQDRVDPIGDDAHTPVPGVVHRYPDRALLKPVHVCPVYCRFCFRREMVGPGARAALTSADLEGALAYIGAHEEIWEVVITGGDPFMLSPARAAALTARLSRLGHVRVIRWHTRMPVADPARVSPAFVAALKSDKAVYVSLHCNHARELTPAARAACARLVDAGLPMISQSVLLKGVNDDPRALADLMRALVETRIKPYYLHHADLAPGTGHFRTSLAAGRALARGLRDDVSGLAQPTYVLDIPGGVSKAVLGESDARWRDGACAVRGRDGVWRDYPEG